MIDMHSKNDNIYKNVMFHALICINNHVITSINFMLSIVNFQIMLNNIFILSSIQIYWKYTLYLFVIYLFFFL